MARRPSFFRPSFARGLLAFVVLGGLACAPAHAADPAPAPADNALRALSGADDGVAGVPGSGHGLDRPTGMGRRSAAALVQPDKVGADDLSRAVAAGNKTQREIVTPEEDSAGSIGGTLLAIAGLILAVVVISRFAGSRS